ncbi:MAG: PilZ domain-containing protein [bacterium]
MTEERRSDPRVPVNLTAKWDGQSGEHEARIEDIGMGGCFVNTVSRVNLGEVIGLEINLPSGKWLRIRGEVITYHEAVGFGMVFTFLTEEVELALREIAG